MIVVCVKAKPAYDKTYVNNLYNMVKRNLTVKHSFLCLTDDNSGLKCHSAPLPKSLPPDCGWYAKLAMFGREYNDTVLYLDLDTIIVDSLDFVASYKGEFAILRDFYRPDGYGSGVMLWNKTPERIWASWATHQRPHGQGDQGIIEDHIKNADILQDLYPNKFVSYKSHCQEGVPVGAAVICFHGDPKPHHFQDGDWPKAVWDGTWVNK